MEKQRVGIDIPLLFACSGGSKMAELTEIVARKLAKDYSIVMTCPTALTARIDFYEEKLRKDEKVVVLEGCRVDCMSKTLQNCGYSGFLRINISDFGFSKEQAENCDTTKFCLEKAFDSTKGLNEDEEIVVKIYDKIKKMLADPGTWEKNRFQYNIREDKFKV